MHVRLVCARAVDTTTASSITTTATATATGGATGDSSTAAADKQPRTPLQGKLKFLSEFTL